eukprot:4374875-Amphidinium_carterae.1
MTMMSTIGAMARSIQAVVGCRLSTPISGIRRLVPLRSVVCQLLAMSCVIPLLKHLTQTICLLLQPETAPNLHLLQQSIVEDAPKPAMFAHLNVLPGRVTGSDSGQIRISQCGQCQQ